MDFFTDAFNTLGITSKTSYKEGMRAYMRLVKQHKPESNPEKFQEITAAWQAVKSFLPKEEAKKSEPGTEVQIEVYEQKNDGAKDIDFVIEEISPRNSISIENLERKNNQQVLVTELSQPINQEVEIEERPISFETTKRFAYVEFSWLQNLYNRSFDPEPIRQVTHEQVIDVLDNETNLDPIVLSLIQNMAIRSYVFDQASYYEYYSTRLESYELAIKQSELVYDYANFNQKQELFRAFCQEGLKKSIVKQNLGVIILNEASPKRLEGLALTKNDARFAENKIKSLKLVDFFKDFFIQFFPPSPLAKIAAFNANEQRAGGGSSKPKKKSFWVYYLLGFLLIRLFVYIAQESQKLNH